MAAILAKHSLTYNDGGSTYVFFFLAPPNMYDGIAALCGVTKLAEDDDLQDMPVTKVEELLISPVASRKSLRIKDGNETKYADIVIAAAEAIVADSALKGQPWHNGGTISRVLDSRKATRY